MVTASKPKAWAKAIAQPATEFDLTPLSIISGAIPAKLRGTLYRNGPARLTRGNQRVGHWFDGDGAILGIHFKDEGVTGIYRYVQTQGYLDEQEQDRFIYPNYGMKAQGGFWNNWLKPIKNAANTSVLALPDRLLALWEGGQPHALDLTMLETNGLDDLSGLTSKQSFSAHPKVDGVTGEIFNYGVTANRQTLLNLYRCNSSGIIEQQNSHILSGLPLIHDFCLAGEYLVFLVSPVRANLIPLILGQKSYSDAMEWKPELGTEILIFERQNLSLVSRGYTDPWFQWHFANGWVNKGDNIVTEFIQYDNFDTNQYLKEVASGYTQTPAKGTLWQLIINPQTAKVIAHRQLLDIQAEFPIVNPQKVGRAWRYTYLSIHHNHDNNHQELLNAIAAFDHQTHNLTIADMGEDCYPSEPIFVLNPDNLEQSWLLTVVYDGKTNKSEVRIYHSHALDHSPLCRIALPEVIPHSFHGTWKSHME